MKITIDTTVDDFDAVISAVHIAYGYASPHSADPADLEESDREGAGITDNCSTLLPGGWTEPKLRRWSQLLTEDAREIVRFVAAQAPEVDWDAVADHVGKFKGLDGPAEGKLIGGAMSSGGHARKKIRGAPKSQPFDRDYGQRVYVIDSKIAKILADELGAPAAV